MQGSVTMGSLFDGSGGFPLAGIITGITPVWASEIEPFPIRVTTKRIPFMEHYGNICDMDGAKLQPVDIIVGGSPCQDMSVAGKRAGLDGERSGLFREQIRIIKEMREATNGKYPRFMVWENVPGAFSSNKGEDFKCVLEETAQIKAATFSVPLPEKGKWSTAGLIVDEENNFSIGWRVLDAQYWGVPQRRRRIFLVADFSGTSSERILFKREGLCWDFKESKRTWQGASGSIEESIGETGRNFAAGFCTEHSAQARGIGYEKEKSPTLRAGVVPGAIMIENHPNDSRVKIDESGTCQSLTGRMGTGGGNIPLTMQIRCGCEGGGKGPLLQEDKSATLSTQNTQTLFQPVKVYGIGSHASNAMKSDNPYSGIYEAETSRTLDLNGGNPACNQGGIAICEPAYAFEPGISKRDGSENRFTEGCSPTLRANMGDNQVAAAYSLQGNMIGRREKNGPQGNGVNEEVSFTLNTTDKHAVVYTIDRESFNCGQGFARNLGISEDGISPTVIARGPGAVSVPTYCTSKASFFTKAEEELANTLVATDFKDPPVINDTEELDYIVRRLMPIECARLQGFPDWWCSRLKTEDPTEEEISLWRKIFETHRKIVSGSKKPKTDKQIEKWLVDPHTDSAEYKMWGNGVALPCVVYVMEGIVEVLDKNIE